jgi:orotate phosphoribosyltransferase
MDVRKIFAEKLLQIKALQINLQQTYIWASGWRSPIYCDNRKVLSYPDVRDFVKNELAKMILAHYPEVDAIAGVATAGIAHGMLAADVLQLPFGYVRPAPKTHGMGNQIEGVFRQDQKIVVVEDLVSTGKSSLEVVEVLRAAGLQVVGMTALFTYGFDVATSAFTSAGVPLCTLSDYATLIELAEENQLVTAAETQALHDWRKDPEHWGQPAPNS